MTEEEVWDPFVDLEDREHLEKVADVRVQYGVLDSSSWASDPDEVRRIILASKAAKAAEKAAEKPPIPPADISWRVPFSDHEVPKAVDRMMGKAQDHGWSTRILYGRGPWLGAQDRTAQNDIVLLGMARAGTLIRACWRNGKFDSGFILSPYNRDPGPNWRAITSPNINKELTSE